MIHGKDIIIYEGSDEPVAIAASKSCTIDKQAGTVETSSPASGTARSYASGRTDWVCTMNNLVLSVKDNMLRVGETYFITMGVRGSSTDTITGYAICTECNITGTVGNLAQGSFRFQGSDRDGTLPPQPGETGYDMTVDQVTAIVYSVVGDGYLSRLHNDTAQGLITFNAGAYIPTGQSLRIGDAYLTYDATNKMIKVWDGTGNEVRGFYATGSVSALGAANGIGGGGGGGDLDRTGLFNILTGVPQDASEWISAKFLKLGNGLTAANDGTLSISGAVTSVALTMPTGFTVTGSPITSSGTLAVSLASGYKLLTSSTVTPGTYTKVTVDTYGRVTGGTSLSKTDIPSLDYIPLTGSDRISGKLETLTDASYDLGSSDYRWRNLYARYGYMTRLYLTSSVYLEYDSTNSAVHLVGAGFYSDSYISALGSSSGGGGGGGFDEDAMWQALATPGSSNKIDASHIPTNISITGNADTATSATTASKLSTTSKTAWGQTYWTSGGVPTSISGDMTSVGSITADYFKLNNTAANPYIRLSHTYSGTDYNYYLQAYQGSLYIGQGSSTRKYLLINSSGNVILNSVSRGYFLTDSSGYLYPLGYDNSENLWIGSTATAATHHTGQTFISAGYDSTNNRGYSTIRICVPNTSNNNGTSYYALHSGNYSTYLDDRYVTLATDQTITGVKTFASTINIRKANYAGVSISHASTSYPNRVLTISQRDTSGSWVTNYAIFASNGYIRLGNNEPTEKLHVDGNILATGGVTALSDIRQKTFLAGVNETMETLAALPIFYYKWKDESRDDYMHIGTSAQAVQKPFPELVLGKDELSVDYGVLGTTIGILNSRTLVTLEQRVTALESKLEERQ